jgi:radical SAM protein with 4Fe4S-binding SPASM domain
MKRMRPIQKYYLSGDAVLKWLEMPSVYIARTDELYELDDDGFGFLRRCASPEGCSSGEDQFIRYCLEEGILTTDAVSERRPLLARSGIPSPRYLELQITDKCNLRCRHCYIGEGRGEELTVGQVRNALREFEEMQGLRVLITGGEPLLHSRFGEINKMLPEFFIRKVLFTNGFLVNRKVLEGLNVDEIQVSIDGLQPAHDALRGSGSFARAMSAVEAAAEVGLEVSVSTMVHAAGLDDFDEMEKLFRSLGVKEWTVDVPCVVGRLERSPGVYVAPEQGGKYLAYGYGGGMHGGTSGYACGPHLISVSSAGVVSRCTFYSGRPAGKIGEGLKECWKRMKPVMLADLKCDCGKLEECRGGCRFRAELLGDPLGQDLYRCYLYDIMKKEKGARGPYSAEKGGGAGEDQKGIEKDGGYL